MLNYKNARYCKTDNRTAIMESARLVEMRYVFLMKIRALRESGYDIVYTDETWYDTHDDAKKGWSDKTKKCSLNNPVSRGKRIIICHAGSRHGFVKNALLLCGKKFKDAYADYHDNMDSDVFETWFRHQLLPNLHAKSVIVIDNASYHSRQLVKIPTMATKKDGMVTFMTTHNIVIPEPLPTKPVLLGCIKAANIQKVYAVDDMAKRAGHVVLRLPPYHCIFNAIEQVWSEVKQNARRQNVYTA